MTFAISMPCSRRPSRSARGDIRSRVCQRMGMTDQQKHGRVGRGRRWLLSALPELPWDREVVCVDRYVTGTRLRLRHMTEVDGTAVHKLDRKLPPFAPGTGVMGTLYLAPNEYGLMQTLPASVVHRRMYFLGEWRIDVFGVALEGLVTAEVECAESLTLAGKTPPFAVIREVTSDPLYGGATLADRVAPPLEALVHGWLSAGQYDETRAALSQLPSSVEHAAAWMLVLHRFQEPRHDGRPYLSHPAEVALRVAQWGGDTAQISAALLHDALEDQAERISPHGDAPAVLEATMGSDVRQLVEALTHPSGAEGYLAYIRSLPPRALEVKVADLSTNALRVAEVEDEARRDYLTRKYAPAMCWLVGRMGGHPAEPVFQAAVDDIFSAVGPQP